MSKLVLFALAGLGAVPALASAQSVPEGVYSRPQGATEICGITAATPAEFEAHVRADPQFENIGGDALYDAWVRKEPLRSWVFAKPGNPAYPAAICRDLYEEGGAMYETFNIACHASKASCDKLYFDFQELGRQMREKIQGRVK